MPAPSWSLGRGASATSLHSFGFPICKMGSPSSPAKGEARRINVLEVISHTNKYRATASPLCGTDKSALSHPVPGSTPHHLGANGTPQAWRTWLGRRFNLPRPAAPARAAWVTRLREPPVPPGAQTALQVAGAHAHRRTSGRASPEAGLEIEAFLSCGG